MRSTLGVAVGLLLLSGCVHAPLRHSYVKQASTLPDLHYRQVLNNLATFANNPGALPYFGVPSGGTAQVDAGGDVAVALTWDPRTLVSEMLGLNGRANVTENWSLAPLNDPHKLELMRCAYQLAVGCPDEECFECTTKLQEFFGEKFAHCQIPQGWFGVGKRKDVPKGACYVGYSCGTYVWVMPEGVDSLSRFSLAILDIATHDHSDSGVVVRKYKYKEGSAPVPDTIELTTNEILPTKDGLPIYFAKDPKDVRSATRSDIRQTLPDRRIMYSDPYRGLFTLPRR